MGKLSPEAQAAIDAFAAKGKQPTVVEAGVAFGIDPEVDKQRRKDKRAIDKAAERQWWNTHDAERLAEQRDQRLREENGFYKS